MTSATNRVTGLFVFAPSAQASKALNATITNDSPYTPVTVLTCASDRFCAAEYPKRFHGKLISGKCARANSNVTHRNGAPAYARTMFVRARRFTPQANPP